MPSITIHQPHDLGTDRARTVVDEVAASIAAQYATRHHWDGDTLHFQRSGVDGTIEISANEVRVQARLSIMLAALRPTIEREIARQLAVRLGGGLA